jgi:Tfp pilus assembly protein PilX
MTLHESRPRERGSAYITALFALVVLTILALALLFVTQTEVQMGANERTANRTFYAADSGLGVAAAKALASGKYTPSSVILNETVALAPIQTVRCDWCPANDDGVPKFWKVNHAATAIAQRVSWQGTTDPPAGATVLKQKTLSATFEFQPWPSPPVESIADATALSKIKF